MSNAEIFVIVEVQEIYDEAIFKVYQAQARQQLLERGCKVVGRGGALFEGSPVLTGALLVQQWPSESAFREWQSSEAYRPLIELRRKAARIRLVVVPRVA